jgi:hypothetical protein
MFICLSFIGKLPSYVVLCVHQIRCFFSGAVYLITDDLGSEYITEMESRGFGVIVVDYAAVRSDVFDDLVKRKHNRFWYLDHLKGREELFLRAFERFFLLQNLMRLGGGGGVDGVDGGGDGGVDGGGDLRDCLFLELDNLIYDDPLLWLPGFSKSELCYMFDNEDRCSSGLMYVKSWESLTGFLEECLRFINESQELLTEMTVLYRYYTKMQEVSPGFVQLLPVYWNNTMGYSDLSYREYRGFGGSGVWDGCIFDALGAGVFLLGADASHTGGIICVGQRAFWCQVDYTLEHFEWKWDGGDGDGVRRPYVWGNEGWILVNNLHVHSKDLASGLSKPFV